MRLYTSHYPLGWLIRPLFRLFVLLYVRPQVDGRQNIPREGAFALVANHSSHADTAVIYASLPRRVRSRVVAAAAEDYFFRGGPLQISSRILFNAVPVSREARRGGPDPLRHIVRALREGYGVLYYPEGTRSSDGSVGQFRAGIGRMVAEFPGLPVVPVWIEGATRVMPKGKTVPRPRRMKVRFGEPLHLQAHPRYRATWQTAADQVRDAVIALSDEPQQPRWRWWQRKGRATPATPPPANAEPADEGAAEQPPAEDTNQ